MLFGHFPLEVAGSALKALIAVASGTKSGIITRGTQKNVFVLPKSVQKHRIRHLLKFLGGHEARIPFDDMLGDCFLFERVLALVIQTSDIEEELALLRFY